MRAQKLPKSNIAKALQDTGIVYGCGVYKLKMTTDAYMLPTNFH